jgi:hypothetical protein
MASNKTTAAKIAEQRTKMEQIQNEINRLLRLEREEARKARNHRISKRGAHLESLLPDTIMLSDKRFFSFLEKTVANDFGRRTLATLVAEQERENAADGVSVTTRENKTPSAKPVQTTATPDGADGSGTGDAARQAG